MQPGNCRSVLGLCSSKGCQASLADTEMRAGGYAESSLETFNHIIISTQNEMPLAVECHELVAHGYSVARSHV
jgi:hypothetical protein